MKLLRCYIGLHEWSEDTWHRSCSQCTKVQVTGYTTDDGDWHEPEEYEFSMILYKKVKRLLRKLGVVNDDRGLQ